MRFSLSRALPWLAAAAVPLAAAENIIESHSLNPCMTNSSFSATLFLVAFTPGNGSLAFNVEGISNIAGNIEAEVELLVYGYSALKTTIDPCDSKDLDGLCPMNSGPLTIKSNIDLSADILKVIPTIAYTIPDLDALVRIKVKDRSTHVQLACVEAELLNGKTVDQKAVAWVTAVIAVLGLVSSAITSGLGHSNTAAHVAANAMSLFGYFQAQAFFGLCAMPLPPIVAAWTQNFQWTMGIIRVTFLQDMATWYQRATGGTPTTYLSQLTEISVEVQKNRRVKRALDFTTGALGRLAARSNAAATEAQAGTERVVLRGIERVGFKAKIETTNIFFTGYTFFVVFVLLTIIGVVAFKFVCEGLVKMGRMKSNKFVDFRNGWRTVLKGILFRVILIGFPQMMVLGFWELTERDSAGIVVLAVLTMLSMIGVLGWASSKVVRIAQRSISMHKNPAYILYSDPTALNKWGFLYVQFKAAAYWFIIPWLIYLLLKAMFIGLSQSSGKVQAIALVIIEAVLLVGVCVLRPWMDKKTNGFNIAIAACNFLSAVHLLMFSDIFGQPAIVTGVMGVVFFVYNAAFALVLLIMLLVASAFALFTKNPDTRYQPMRDDRGSFIKSQTQLTTELDALGATARGEGKGTHPSSRSRLDDDDDFSSTEERRQLAAKEGAFSEHYATAPPRSPINPSASPVSSYYDRASPAPSGGYAPPRNDVQQRSANNSSPWQRGAGYDQH
ncbi:TRP-domain-containing protein [Dothidotthia symphoricarpi CBS 119687]|uniref:TRP-domain-containing protein n=1 Tax=Dothidotthia symphoricarpi CBS 119687 TaxID=1392245 RepID=A0A6A6APS9_9PLEO|nr:TRP-domain-containing protein [Dothidotthia symphoricarpi CBS 119687]KAF2133800.1 TRP-domain-containing protein [Dothidotthia symphoricarpi CBS 119687]